MGSSLWQDNEPGTYEAVRQHARDAYQHATETDDATRGQVAAFALAERLKDEHEGASPLADEPASVFSDLLASALGLVDWHEIASHLCWARDPHIVESVEMSLDLVRDPFARWNETAQRLKWLSD